jgi:hypothetical protein
MTTSNTSSIRVKQMGANHKANGGPTGEAVGPRRGGMQRRPKGQVCPRRDTRRR